MTIAGDAQHRIDSYLDRLRRGLRGMNRDEVGEIVEELRSHILDKAASGEPSHEITEPGIDAALATLGSPEQLAGQYLTDTLLARAEASRSPVQILSSLFRWASLSAAGFFVLLGSVLGYVFGAAFILVAALKPFHPHSAGLWLFSNGADDYEFSFRLGFGSIPASGRDLLGWWIVRSDGW